MKIPLDTCTFLWITLDAPELSERARQLYLDPEHEVYLSAVTAWEIGVKYALGKLPLPTNPETFIPPQRVGHNLIALAFDEPSALRVAGLPTLHKDPFDRMLICQAIEHGLTILTPDPEIRRHPSVLAEW